jgi:S-adenosylmethionine:tRNA ribosyltransferase-isomerase
MSVPEDLDLHLDQYDYALPPSQIAQRPTAHRGDSRLLVLDRCTGAISHRRFGDIVDLLAPGDCLVVNESRVLAARLLGALDTGGRVEVLLLRPSAEDSAVWECLARPASKGRPGRRVRFGAAPWIEVEFLGDLEEPGAKRVRVEASIPLEEALQAVGHVPLPPYIQRPDDEEDKDRYQTVYASVPGSVAAPTAGLHVTEEILERLTTRGVTLAKVILEVGIGTFRPISTERIDEHRMHSERYRVDGAAAAAINAARGAGGRVVAVGTTSVRVLESVASADGSIAAAEGETDLFIRPGYQFRAIDALLTNFHLPRSSLLVMVSALAGRRRVLAAYREAVAEGYRFFSYGDAMLIHSDRRSPGASASRASGERSPSAG